MSVGSKWSDYHSMGYRIYRGSTLLNVGDADGNRARTTGGTNFGNGGNRSPSTILHKLLR